MIIKFLAVPIDVFHDKKGMLVATIIDRLSSLAISPITPSSSNRDESMQIEEKKIRRSRRNENKEENGNWMEDAEATRKKMEERV